MKKILTIILSASILSSAAYADEDKIIATYKGGEVKESQIMQQFKSALDMQPVNQGKKFSELDSNLQEALVKGYINVKLLEQEAINQRLEASKEFQEKLNNVKSQLLQQELVERHIKSMLTDKMIDDEYNKLVDSLKGKEEIKVSHILLDAEEKAKEVKKKLSKGAKFSDLAKEFSLDDGSKATGGELGYIMKGQLVPEFEEKALSMKVNEISDPVKTQFGWHIIKVLDKRPAKIPTKEEAKQGINAKLSREVVEKYFTDLANKAEIKLNLPKKIEPAKDEAAKK